MRKIFTPRDIGIINPKNWKVNLKTKFRYLSGVMSQYNNLEVQLTKISFFNKGETLLKTFYNLIQ